MYLFISRMPKKIYITRGYLKKNKNYILENK